ncbi:MAG: N-acetylmuramic acid 6-phosphate etherase [Lachnospiraceae bacterium]|nr:N-acetylmuramic acid 6-phosphate etherase [Lachnospiraceae bacterium]
MLKTETRNPKSMHLDRMDTLSMLELMNEENRNSVEAVERALPEIAKAADLIADAVGKGHSLVYLGAGTSGRLGIIDAAECPPTFGVEDTVVRGVIAGGPERLVKAGENAEDSYETGASDAEKVLRPGDVLVGISAAGGAKYVVGALEKARALGCNTIALTSNPGTAVTKAANLSIVCDTGPEVLTGSTRLKAGNSQKFVLNMLSTAAMVKTGKVYENLMINVKPSNEKLRGRVIRITKEILGCSEEEAVRRLEAHHWSIRETVEAPAERRES